MMVCYPLGTPAKAGFLLSQHLQRQMKCQFYSSVSGSSSNSCCLVCNPGRTTTRYSRISVLNPSFCTLSRGLQTLRQISSKSALPMRWGNYLVVKRLVGSNKSHEACFDVSFGSRWTTLTLLGRKWGVPSGLKCRPCRNRVSWTQGYASVGLLLGSFICFSTFDPDYAEALQEKEAHHAPPSGQLSHGKEVHTDYSVIGIPGDGRCLFRSVAHGVCLRSGKLVSESVQRELADELRARVADEFIRRRKETEWFIEGDFDTYVSQIRKPHVWGGEPELLMLSHVLEMPITVYMRDEKSNGLISIAEYGQEYGKENPIRVLYHGFGHYDALLFPGNKGSRSRL